MKPQSKIASFFNALFVTDYKLRIISKIERVVEKMNPTEKVFFVIVSIIVVFSGLTALVKVHNYFLVEIPSFGGTLTEGALGSPRFINPILSISDNDKSISSLIYSGLMKSGHNNVFIPDLAENYEITNEGKTYTFKIRDDAYFHDGRPVTTDDVIFTINKIMDPVIKSNRQANWVGVTMEKIDDKNIKFNLNKAYAPFMESLTVGILPKHIWQEASSEEFPFSQFNIEAVGSGPYKIKKVERNGGGVLTSITLASYQKYYSKRPLIEKIVFKFFQNENELYQAFKNKDIDSAIGIPPSLAKNLVNKNPSTKNVLLPRVFGLFLNQNTAPVFLNKEVREALEISAPKKRIVDEVLFGFGKPLNGPTPKNIETNEEKFGSNIEQAKKILESNGWKLNENNVLEKDTKSGKIPLSFSITTSDSMDLKNTASILKETWSELGAVIDIKIFESSDLSQNVIKGRKYDSLLFGEMIGENTDMFPFWHSSERNDPGLNIALYTNITVDKLLEELRNNLYDQNNKEKKEQLIEEINKDLPAIFLFTPELNYFKAEKVKNIKLKEISSPSERFAFINEWFIETDKVWKIFAK